MDNQKSLATIGTTENAALLFRTIDPKNELNTDERALFLSVCHITGLNALTREVYALKAGGRMFIHTGIDGHRKIAGDTGLYAGQVGPEWAGDDGAWKSVWLDAKPPAACRVGVLARGDTQPTWGVVTYKGYVRQGSPQWQSNPSNQMAVRAEAQALRKRFPRTLSMLTLSDRDEGNDTNHTTSSVVEPDLPALPAPPPSTPGTWQHIADHGTDEPVAESPSVVQDQAPIHESDDVAPEAVSSVETAPEAVQRASDVPAPAEMPRPRGRPPAANATLPDDHPLVVQAKGLWSQLLAVHISPDRPARTETALTAWIAKHTTELADATPPVQESF